MINKPIKQKVMKAEIRKQIREYILSDVNQTLARLGVSEKVVETKERNSLLGNIHYDFESPAIHQMPMMFKKVYVDGYMTAVEIKSDRDRFYELTDENDIVVVNLSYRFKSFEGGSNGTEIGRVIYAVSKELPEHFVCGRNYVQKIEGLLI